MADFIKKHKIKCKVLKQTEDYWGNSQFIELSEDRTVYKRLADSIATLVIPKGTVCHVPIRVRTQGKCRTEFCIVEKIMTLSNDRRSKRIRSDVSYHNHIFAGQVTYKELSFVFPRGPKFSKKFEECAAGIHFFFTKSEALAYG